MTFNPDIHHRKSIRVKNYDYSKNGAYFITICTHERELYFEKYQELINILNQEWSNLVQRYNNIILYEFVIMPNHIHGIIFIVDEEIVVGKKRAEVNSEIKRAEVNPAPTFTPFIMPMLNLKNDDSKITLGDIICSFKSLCVRQWLRHINENNLEARSKFWQRNYYEKIIRDQNMLDMARKYIINNPSNWKIDKLNPISKLLIK